MRGCNQRTLRCIGLGTVAGNAFVADLSKKLGTIACPRCEAPMEEVVRIAPAQNGPGLIGYETVAAGETIDTIARRYGVPASVIMQANKARQKNQPV